MFVLATLLWFGLSHFYDKVQVALKYNSQLQSRNQQLFKRWMRTSIWAMRDMIPCFIGSRSQHFQSQLRKLSTLGYPFGACHTHRLLWPFQWLCWSWTKCQNQSGKWIRFIWNGSGKLYTWSLFFHSGVDLHKHDGYFQSELIFPSSRFSSNLGTFYPNEQLSHQETRLWILTP